MNGLSYFLLVGTAFGDIKNQNSLKYPQQSLIPYS